MNLNLLTNGQSPPLRGVSIPIRDLMNLNLNGTVNSVPDAGFNPY